MSPSQEMPQRISLLIPNLRGGGAERVAVNLANNFVQRGYTVDMVMLVADGVFISDLHSAVNIVDLESPRIRNAFFPLIRYLRKARPSALLACMWPLTVIAVLARAVSRIPMRLVVAEHTTWSRSKLLAKPMNAGLIRTSMHFLLPKADAIVSVSHGAADDLARFANIDTNAITCIYNPIVGDNNDDVTDPDLPEEWLVGQHKKVLAIGALKEVKDYPTLLNAFALVVQRVDARLLILGEGECRAELETQVRQLRLETRVFMPGFVQNVAAYLQQADLHVLSSTCEGFGNVIVEALAAGTPVVSTDCPSGPQEILCDGLYGRLVPTGDAAEMAAAIIESLEAKHNSAALIKRAQDFSIDKATNRYLRLFF